MNRSGFVLLITVLSLTFAGFCLIAEPTNAQETCSLTVEVRTQETEQPIANASVSIEGPFEACAQTDSTGQVTFCDIPSGNYSVIVSVESYPNSSPQQIVVRGETRTVVHFSYTRAYFSYTPLHPYTDQTVTFNASLSSTSTRMVNYSWSFGDGTKGTGMYVNHTYPKAATYSVILTVTSTVGQASYSQLVSVSTVYSDEPFLPWVFVLVPLIIPPILIWRRRRYYVIITSRVPPNERHPHCPGDDTKCSDCKLTPC
jgi:PKD repeat protein